MRHAFRFDRAVEDRRAAATHADESAPPSQGSGEATAGGLAAVLALLQGAVGSFERAGEAGPAELKAWRAQLAGTARRAEATLPPAGRAVLESVLPALASADLGLAERQQDAADRATAAEGARAFAQLEQLTRQGLPLDQALATADELFAALSGGCLLGTVLGAAKGLAHERLAAAKLEARIAADPEAALDAAPEATLLSPATRQRLEAEREALLAERLTSRQAEYLAGLAGGQGAPAPSEAQLLQALGPVLGAKAWQAFERQQQRTRTAAAGFAAVERVVPGIARLLQRPGTADFARRLAIALQEGEARPELWTPAETREKAEAWIAIHAEAPGADAASEARRANAILGFLESHVTTLPDDLQPHALAALGHQGAGAATPGALAAVAAALRDGRRVEAFALAKAVEDGIEGGRWEQAASPVLPGAKTEPQVDEGAVAGLATDAATALDLPSTGAAIGAWDAPLYADGRQAELLELYRSITALADDPTGLPAVLASIDARFPGGGPAAEQLKRQAELLTNPDATHGQRFEVIDELSATADRVERGQPHSKPWAKAVEALAGLERLTGLRLRPSQVAGMVAVFEPGGDQPALELPLPLFVLLADDAEAVAEFTRLFAKLQRGEPLDDELAALEQKLVRHVTGASVEFGEPPQAWQDRSDFDAMRASIEGAQSKLAEGADPAEVALHLAQVLLEDELDDTDLAVAALETALEFLPYYDLVDLGINSAELVEALISGDGDRALAAGLGAALAAIGLIPGVGALAKRGLRWIGKGLGLLPSPARRSQDWLSGKRVDDASGDVSQTQDISEVPDHSSSPTPHEGYSDQSVAVAQSPEPEPPNSVADDAVEREAGANLPSDEDLPQVAAEPDKAAPNAEGKEHAESPSNDPKPTPDASDRPRTLTQSEMAARSDEFLSNGKRPPAPLPIANIIGKKWRKIPKYKHAQLLGSVRNLSGEIAENFVRPYSEARLRRDGFEPLEPNLPCVFDGVAFEPDTVGVRFDATVVGADYRGKTIQVGDRHFRIEDVTLSDVKFASAQLDGPKGKVHRALKAAGHEGIKKETPLLDDVPKEELVAAINNNPAAKAHKVVVTLEDIERVQRTLRRGTTLHEGLMILFGTLLAAQAEEQLES